MKSKHNITKGENRKNKALTKTGVNYSILPILFIFVFSFLLFLPFSSAQGLSNPSTAATFTTFTGNLTNLSEMQDVNIPSPTNADVLKYNSGLGKWISQAETDPVWLSEKSNYYLKSNPFGFYNSSDFSISDYYTQTQIDGFNLSKWTDDLGDRGYTSLSNFTNDPGYITSLVETDPLWSSNQSLVYLKSNPFGFYNITDFDITNYYLKSNPFSFYNLSDFSISDYFTKLEILNFNYYNSTDFDINNYYLKSNPLGFFNSTNPQTETDPLWTSNQSLIYLKSNPFSFWNDTYATFNKTYADTIYSPIGFAGNPFDQSLNTTDSPTFNNLTSTGFFIGDGSLLTGVISSVSDYTILSKWANITDAPTNLSFFIDDLGDRGYTSLSNFTNDPGYITSFTETDPLWSSNQSLYSTTAQILAFGYYNSSDFIITDYYLKSNPFGFYNSTDFSITDYFTKSEVLAFNYYNSSDFNISDYFTSAQILGFNYYNATDFVITDYFTKTEILNFNYYNATDFDINDYYLKSNPFSFYNSTTIPDFILSSNEGNLNVNSSNYWDNLDTVNSTQFENNGGTLSIILSWFSSQFDSLFSAKNTDDLTEGLTNLYDNQTWNESLADTLYADISIISDNSSWNESHANTLYISQSNEPNLNVNSSDFWDNLDTPSDINAGDINDDGTYVKTIGDTMTGDLNMFGSNITNITSTLYDITIGCSDDTAGAFCYDIESDTMRFVTISGQVLQMNQETTMPVKNIHGINVDDGSVVYIMGATGTNPNFKLAKADNLSTSGLLGVVTKDCANNQVCPVVFFALVHEFDTSPYSAGDHLYLSDIEEGNFTTIPPEFPNNPIWVATVIRVHPTEGTIFVFPRIDSSNGITLNNLGLVGDFIQTDYKVRSLEGHANIGQNVFAIEMNGTTGQDLPHLILQPGGPEQASIGVRSWIFVPEAPNCLNNTNRTDSNCYATEGGFTWQKVDFNTTISEGADVGITGELEVIKDVLIQGNLNMSGNNITGLNSLISSTGSMITKGTPETSLSGADNAFTLLNGRDVTSEEVIFTKIAKRNGIFKYSMLQQLGFSGFANVLDRSWMIRDMNVSTDAMELMNCTTFQTNLGVPDNLKVDCATDLSGADLILEDDLLIGGDFKLKNSDGTWKFLTRDLTLQDRLLSNLVLNRFNATLTGTNFSFVEAKGETLIINLDANETITNKLSDSVTITEGTNITPITNFIYYQDKFNPTLTRAATDPTINNAPVAQFIQGSGWTYASIIDEQNEENALSQIFSRFKNQGPLYVSGYSQDATSTNINFTTGIINIITHEDISTNIVDTDTGYFYIEDGTDYIQLTGLDNIDEYSDGTAISNNKYFNVVFGVLHNDMNGGDNRMIAIIQAGTAEYNSVTTAETDTFQLANFFTQDSLLNQMYIPVARVVIQRTAGVNTIQTLSTGNLFIDLRGITSSAGGAAGSPTITDHSLLSNLDYASSGHTGFLSDDYNNLFNFTNGPGYYNITDFDINDYYLKSNPFGFFNSTNPQIETDPLWTSNQSLVYLNSNPFSFYNITNFDINDYYLESNPFSFYNSTTLQNLSQLSDNLGNRGYTSLSNFTNNQGFYNISDFDINDYYLKSNPFGFFNSTNPQTETDPLWTSNQSLVYLKSNPFGFYNISDFDIGDYYLESNPFSFYNSTDFSISDYYNKTEVDGFSLSKWTDDLGNRGYTNLFNFTNGPGYYNSTDFSISDYYLKSNPFGFFNSTNPQTETDPLWTSNQSLVYLKSNPFSFYNSTDFSISDYYLKSNPFDFYNITDFDINDYYLESNPFSFYNSTDFSISDYYLKSNPFGFFNSTNPQTETDPLWTGNQTNVAFTNVEETFSGNVTMEGLKLENDPTNHRIYDNSTCTIITGDTTRLLLC